MKPAADTASDGADAVTVAGYVEALTANAALGWAWMPGQTAPLSMELRLGADVLSRCIADELRDDLAQNGIGNGRHAFNLPIPEAARPRLGDLRVVARTPDGAAIPLRTPPVADGVAERLNQLARGMEAIIGSQRVLHRNVQAALLGPANSAAAGPAAAELAATQATLGEAIATLELFVARLEVAMAGFVAPPAPATPRQWAMVAATGLAVTALVVSAIALFRALPG